MLKDYYNILEIPTHSTLQEIKQAFRRLAMVYHPDKRINDPYADAKYEEIREAYEVLTNPIRKEAYLQERWYDQSLGKRNVGELTPVSILRLSLELERYVSSLDVHRMNKEGLNNHVNELLSDDTIAMLTQFNDTAINQQIINTLLMVMKPLPLKYVITLSNRLEKLAGNNETTLQRIKSSLRQHQKSFLWTKYQALVIVVITFLVCLLIYLTSK